MITYSDNLYLTDKTRKKIDKIKQKIDTRSGMIGIVIIALSQNEKDVLELEDEIIGDMEIVYVEKMSEVLKEVFA